MSNQNSNRAGAVAKVLADKLASEGKSEFPKGSLALVLALDSMEQSDTPNINDVAHELSLFGVRLV